MGDVYALSLYFRTFGFTYWGEIHVPVSLLLLYLHLSSLPSQLKPHPWINHASSFQPWFKKGLVGILEFLSGQLNVLSHGSNIVVIQL